MHYEIQLGPYNKDTKTFAILETIPCYTRKKLVHELSLLDGHPLEEVYTDEVIERFTSTEEKPITIPINWLSLIEIYNKHPHLQELEEHNTEDFTERTCSMRIIKR